MKMKLLHTLVLAFMLMVGCVTDAAADRIKVACMGNSITYGAGIKDSSKTYPAQLQDMLGDGYEVMNFGQNSQTVQMDGYDLTEGSKPGDCAYRNKDKYRKALEYKPDIVVLKLGTNDSKNINWTAASPAAFRNDLNDMLDELISNSDPEIFLCYPLRVRKPDWTINEKNLHEIINIIRDVALMRGITIVNLHTIFEDRLGDEWESVYVDGVHPNPEGASIIARCVADAILGDYTGDALEVSHVK